MKRSLVTCGFFVAVFLGLGSVSNAGTYYWNLAAPNEGNWTTGSNWNQGSPPGATDRAYINNGGTVLIGSGDTIAVGDRVQIGYGAGATGTFNMAGGTINTTATGVANLVVRNNATAAGTFNGWGTVNLDGQLQNAGKVIADGGGADHTLDMSSFDSAVNQLDNTTDNGWYARNGGKLLLPNIAISGNTTVYWGDAAGIDLVNSVNLTFDSEASGALTGSLLATDRSDVNTDGNTFIGVWDFAGPAFTSVDMAFHYDNALATALGIDVDDLQVFHYNGSSWNALGGTVNAGSSTISVDGVDSFSQFAVGVPEPATLSLLAAGGLGIFRRRKK